MALLSVTFDKAQIGRLLDDEVRALSKRMRAATEKTGRQMLLEPLRDHTGAALGGFKLPTTWRAAVYPKDDATTLSPAFFVYSKAPKIIAAFARGATIRPVGGGKYLWIPTENVPLTPGGGRMKPRAVAAKVGPFVFRPARGGGLVALAKATKYRARSRGRGPGALKVKRGGELTVFYILKPQVTLRKRLDLDAIAQRAGASYRIALQSAANKS